jgi:hypothetical protein
MTTVNVADVQAVAAKLAERGAHWCDQEYGVDWPVRIDLDQLDMIEQDRCVIGQLEGDFSALYDRLPTGSIDAQDVWAAHHGFVAPADYYGDVSEARVYAEYAALTEAWRAIIEARRAQQ